MFPEDLDLKLKNVVTAQLAAAVSKSALGWWLEYFPSYQNMLTVLVKTKVMFKLRLNFFPNVISFLMSSVSFPVG